MFEALLEKILLSHFGQFLSGLDRKYIHLGVWSGNLVIENVSLKPEALELLELPLQLRFSHIDKFQVNVPWSKLSQQSVDIYIQNVFVIIAHKPKGEWNPSNYKFELLDKFLKKTIEEFLQNKAKLSTNKDNLAPNNSNMPISVDKQGIFDRLITKVIDNIQIIVQNIHIRYENDLEKPGFSWGITLSELRILTTDSTYKTKIFYDRSDPKQKDPLIYKKIELIKLGLYWNSNDLQFISNLKSEILIGKMHNFSLYDHEETEGVKSFTKRIDYIVTITCEVKATINSNSGNVMTNTISQNPEIQVLLSLKTLNFNIKNSQLQDFIRMMESFDNYQFAYHKEKAKTRKKIKHPIRQPRFISPFQALPNQNDNISYYKKLWKYIGNEVIIRKLKKKQFETLFLRILKPKKGPAINLADQKDFLRVLEKKEIILFKKIVAEIEIEELYKWVKEVFFKEEWQKISQKQKKIFPTICGKSKNLKKQKILLNSALTELGVTHSGDLMIADHNDQEDIAAFFANKAETPMNLTFFRFELDEFSIRLTKRLKKFDEGLIFRLKSLQFGLDFKPFSLEIRSEIREIDVDLINNCEAKNEIIIPILKKNLDYQKKKHRFMSFNLVKKPESIEIDLNVGAIEIIYYPSIMIKLMSYFSVQSSEQGVKNLAFEEYQILQQKNNSLFENNEKTIEFSIKVRVASPSLIIPFLQYNDLQSPCFVLNLGDIELHNEDNDLFLKHRTKKIDYQSFLLTFSAIQMFFYSSITYYYMIKKYGEITNIPDFLNDGAVKNEKFQIIENMRMKSHIQRSRNISKDRASLRVFLDFEDFVVNFSPKTFSDLMNFKKYFNNPDFRTQELLQTEMKPLFDNAFRKGMLRKKEATFKNWSTYYVVFSGGYLYFFYSQRDFKYSSYLYIKDSVVKECSHEIGVPFSFKISNKIADTFLACNNHNDMKSWVKLLQKKIHEFSFKFYQISVQNKPKMEAVGKIPDYNLITLSLNARIPTLHLNFLDYNVKKTLQVSFSTIEISLIQRLLDMELDLHLSAFKFEDFFENYEARHRKPLIVSQELKAKKNLLPNLGKCKQNKQTILENCLNVSVKILEKNNPAYKNTECEVSVFLHSFLINWKSKVFVYLMKFLLEEPEFNIDLMHLHEGEKKALLDVSPKLRHEQTMREFTKKLTIKREELLDDEDKMESTPFINQEDNLVSIDLSLNLIELNMMMKTFPLAKIELPDFQGNIAMKSEAMEMNFTINNIKLKQILGFMPFGLYLIENDNSIEISYISYDNNSKLISNNIASKISVTIRGLQIIWLQQAMLRIIDFINEDIAAVLTNDYKTPLPIKEDHLFLASFIKKPKFSSMNVTLFDTCIVLKARPNDHQTINLLIKEIRVQNFQEKTFERLKLFSKTDLVFLKMKECYQLANEGLWLENYAIGLYDWHLSFSMHERDKIYFLSNNSKPWVFSILVEKLCMAEEYSKIFAENYILDKTMKILSCFDPLDIRLQYDSYQYLIDVLLNNISYDDGLDSEISNKTRTANETKNPLEFTLDIPLFHLLLEKPNKKIEKFYNLKQFPFTEFSFYGNRISYTKDSYSNTEINILSQDFHAEVFEYLDDNNEGFKVLVSGFLRKIFQETISLPIFLKSRRLMNPTMKTKIDDAFKTREIRFNKEKITKELRNIVYSIGRARFSLNMETNQQNKRLSLTWNNFLFLINSGFLMKLLDYVKLRENMGPYAKNNSEFERMGAVKKKEKEKSMSIEVIFRNVLFCIECSNEEHMMAIQALIQVKYDSSQENTANDPENEDILPENVDNLSSIEQASEKDASFFSIKKKKNLSLHSKHHRNLQTTGRFLKKNQEDTSMSLLDVSIKKFELFNCNRADLFQEKPEDYDLWKLEIKRRALTQPFAFTFASEEFVCFCLKSQKTQMKESLFSLSSSRANLSYKDLLLLYETALFQGESLKSTEEERKQETFIGEGNNPSIFLLPSSSSSEEEEGKSEGSQDRRSLNFEDNLSINSEERINMPLEREENITIDSRTSFSFNSEHFEIILIDDVGKTLIPVVQISLLFKYLSFEANSTKKMLKGPFEMSISYYNPVCGKLEPIFEETNLIVCYIKNEQNSPDTYITLELDSTVDSQCLNINMSEEMIAGLLKTYWSLERELALFNVKQQEFSSNFNRKESQKNIPYQGKLLRKNTVSKKYYQNYMKYVSIYSITNETGYNLELIRDEINIKSAYINLQKSFNPGLNARNTLEEQFGKEIIIRNGETENFEVISDETSFGRTFHKSHTISINFETFSGKSIEIKNIELNRLRKKRYYWGESTFNLNKRFFIGEVRVIGSRKDLLLSSSIVFTNNLMRKAFILLKNPSFKVLQLEIPPEASKAVPVEYVEEVGSFQVKILTNDDSYTKTARNSVKTDFSWPLDFNSLRTLAETNSGVYTLELAHSTSFSLLKVEKLIDFCEKLLISINPCFRITNCLPIPIEFSLFSSHDEQASRTFEKHLHENEDLSQEEADQIYYLCPQIQHHELYFSLKDKLFMYLKIPGFETIKKINFYDANQEPTTENISENYQLFPIRLRSSNSELIADEEECSSLIYIVKAVVQKNKEITRDFFLFVKICLINQTYQELDFYGYYKKQAKKIKINKTIVNKKTTAAASLGHIFLLNQQRSLMISLQGHYHETTNEVNIQENGNFSVELKTAKDDLFNLYEYAISIKIVKSVHPLNLETKIIEISHRYIVINKTTVPLEISQFLTHKNLLHERKESNNILLIRPNERSPFNWSDCTKDKSIVVRVASLNQNDSNVWFWSGSIDINGSKSLSFVLNRKGASFIPNSQHNIQDAADSNECLYIKLDIIKAKATFFLSFIQLGPENYSYILRNDTSSYLIKYKQNIVLSRNENETFLSNYENIINKELLLLKDTSRPFAWVFPNLNPELQIQFSHTTELLKPETFTFNLDTIIEARDIILKKAYDEESVLRVKVRTVIHGPTRVLQFYEKETYDNNYSSAKYTEGAMVASSNRRLSSMLIARKRGKPLSMVNPESSIMKHMEKNDENIEEENSQEKIILMVFANFDRIGISIIARNKEKKLVELMFVHILGLEFLLIEEKTFKTFQFRVKYLNIDNNSDYRSLIPVIFTPSEKRGILESRTKFYFDIFVKYNHKSKEIIWFDSLRAEISKTTIKFDEDFVHLLFQWVESLNLIIDGGLEEDGETMLKKPVLPTDVLFLPFHELENRSFNWKIINDKQSFNISLYRNAFEILELFEKKSKIGFAEWEWLEIPESNRYIYIKELILPPIDFFLSFSRRIKTAKSDTNFDMLTNALGKAFMNIDEAPIHLQGFKLNFIFDTKHGIIDKLTEHYKTSIISTVLKVIGSINIIGNPIGLYNYIKSGFVEMIDRPRQGLVHGPLEAGLGAIIGAGCLLKQTFAGTFNSLHHITESIATGLTILSFDDSFIEKRRKFKLKKPKNVIEGMDQGFKSIYSGLEEGVSGLVLKPYKGAKAQGINGLFKGTVHGLSGLLLKPITGICDATSKTAEGLKNTTVHFDDKPNEERIRFPRVFYEREKYIKKYDCVDAEAVQILQEVKKGRYEESFFIDAFVINKKKDTCLLIILQDDLLCYSLNRRKFYWKTSMDNIDRVEKNQDLKNEKYVNVRIWLKKVNENKENKIIEFKYDEKKKNGRKSNYNLFSSFMKALEMQREEELDFVL